ncbi:MAG: murein transglycosylase, partial [Polyangiaceae bacterium]|nr:murein transglycosylase [Polyangiaceae bacterium]
MASLVERRRPWSMRVARVAGAGLCLACLVAAAPASASDTQRPAGEAPAKPATKPPVKPPAKPRAVDVAVRRAVAGGPIADDLLTPGSESPELRALREAERELFPPAAPAPGHPWPAELPLLATRDAGPTVVATGLPPAFAPPPPTPEAASLAWLAHLEQPDLPVRLDDRVVRYLQFFHDDPRGRWSFTTLYRHSGRWREMIRRTL